MTDRTALLEAAMEDPGYLARQRRLARLSLADLIEESEGPDNPASVGLRWMAEMDLQPSQGAYSGLMAWRWWSPEAINSVARHRLPPELYYLIPGSVGSLGVNYPTPLEAITALGEVILRYRAGERFVEEQESETT